MLCWGRNIPRGLAICKQKGWIGFPFLMLPQQQGSTAPMVQ